MTEMKEIADATDSFAALVKAVLKFFVAKVGDMRRRGRW